jgi:multiple sugar transport system ATP-binding protein
MRTELKEMQASLGSTCIYVTHDFMEAMALGDRIAIINKGKIIQVGSGDEIYYMPTNEFVASLMGEPQINIIPSTIKAEGKKYDLCFDVLGKEISMDMPVDE